MILEVPVDSPGYGPRDSFNDCVEYSISVEEEIEANDPEYQWVRIDLTSINGIGERMGTTLGRNTAVRKLSFGRDPDYWNDESRIPPVSAQDLESLLQGLIENNKNIESLIFEDGSLCGFTSGNLPQLLEQFVKGTAGTLTELQVGKYDEYDLPSEVILSVVQSCSSLKVFIWDKCAMLGSFDHRAKLLQLLGRNQDLHEVQAAFHEDHMNQFISFLKGNRTIQVLKCEIYFHDDSDDSDYSDDEEGDEECTLLGPFLHFLCFNNDTIQDASFSCNLPISEEEKEQISTLVEINRKYASAQRVIGKEGDNKRKHLLPHILASIDTAGPAAPDERIDSHRLNAVFKLIKNTPAKIVDSRGVVKESDEGKKRKRGD